MGDIYPGSVAVIGISAASNGGIAGFLHPSALGGNKIPGERVIRA